MAFVSIISATLLAPGLLANVSLASEHIAPSPVTGTGLRGSWLPKIDADTWPGWEPTLKFAQQFETWPNKKVPDDLQVWCKGFIPKNATTAIIGGYPIMPIKGPGGIPIPGLLGMCAGTDGRDWSNEAPSSARPHDARFWSWIEVARGHGAGVDTSASCGMSHNICCEKSGCHGGYKYGEVTCSKHCPDTEMQVKRIACWSEGATKNGTSWMQYGRECNGGAIVAAKAYIQGRGGNPCADVLGVKSPAASWDVGVAVFPTKRKVTITGYVDDAPSYECYARAKDNMKWGPTVTLAQLPIELSENIALELLGYSDRPVNPDGLFFDLPEPDASAERSSVVV